MGYTGRVSYKAGCKKIMVEKKFARSFDTLKDIVAFTEQFFEDQGIDPSLRTVVDLAVEELFVNMVKYDTETTENILIGMKQDGEGIEVRLTDFGVDKFDPTELRNVDIDAPLEDREAGGLGLYLVLKMVDAIHYEYRNRTSKITFWKSAGDSHVQH